MEVGTLNAIQLLSLVALLLVPLSSAQEGNGNGHAYGLLGEPGNSAGHAQRPDERGPPQSEEPDSIELEATAQEDKAKLDWIVRGRAHRVQAFDIYRSENGAPAERIATVDAKHRSFTDSTLAPVGAYTYTVVAAMDDGTMTESNQSSPVIRSAVCSWISVSPKGSPPVMFHDECSPFNLEGVFFS